MVGFEDGATALVEQDGWRSWRNSREIRWTSEDGTKITVPVGATTDFASVPRPFIWFIPRYGRWTKPSIIHDHLWRELSPHEVSWRDADRYFREAMKHTEVPALRRWIMWSAVRWAALFTKGGAWRGWWRDAPAAVLFILLALVFVGPPAVLILPAMTVYHLVEWLVYGVARLFRRPEVEPGIDLKSG